MASFIQASTIAAPSLDIPLSRLMEDFAVAEEKVVLKHIALQQDLLI